MPKATPWGSSPSLTCSPPAQINNNNKIPLKFSYTTNKPNFMLLHLMQQTDAQGASEPIIIAQFGGKRGLASQASAQLPHVR